MTTSLIITAIALVALLALVLIGYSCRAWLALRWRAILSILPLPMLALAASYGVYSFATLFAPLWVAVAQAAAFEMTYIGLATLDNLDQSQRKRASNISIGAVAVSIIYNSLAGIGHRNPQAFVNLDWYWELILGILHGAPLALVAYFVSDLLLHRPAASKQSSPKPSVTTTKRASARTRIRVLRPRQASARLTRGASKSMVATPIDDKTKEVVRLRDEQGLSFPQIGKELGFSRQAAQQRYAAAKEQGYV